MEKLMKQAQNHLHPQSAQNPPQVNQAHPGNKEKSYKNWLRVQASDLWRRELMTLKRSKHTYNTTPQTSNESICTNRPPT